MDVRFERGVMHVQRHRDSTWDETEQIPAYGSYSKWPSRSPAAASPAALPVSDATQHMDLTEDGRTELIRLVDDGVDDQEHGVTHVPWWVLFIFTVGCLASVGLVVGLVWVVIYWLFT
jgi:hypothetical protein